jgi:acyl carrier protein
MEVSKEINMKSIEEKLYRIIEEVLDVKRNEIKPDLSWEKSNTDSFALVELIVAVQEQFGINFDSTELKDMKTVGDLLTAIQIKLKAVS